MDYFDSKSLQSKDVDRTALEYEMQEEDSFQQSLRPKSLAEYIGQTHLCENIEIAISAAKRRGESLDHVLFHGPPGLGKTTLAGVLASEMGASLSITSGPVLERPGDLAAILSNMSHGSVLFIDEIHRLNRVVEEILYPAMEDFTIDIVVGQGPSARSVRLDLAPFTLVGATTRTGLLTAPLRDRFGITERVEFYSESELSMIVRRSARILSIALDEGGAAQIARRSRGTPRIANRLLKRARDFAQERADSIITEEVADQALSLLEIDQQGLDRMDRLLLCTVIDSFGGGPVGLDTLAAALHEDKQTIEDVYEPYLLQQGFLKRTPRGREATKKAFSYFKRIIPNAASSRAGGVSALQIKIPE